MGHKKRPRPRTKKSGRKGTKRRKVKKAVRPMGRQSRPLARTITSNRVSKFASRWSTGRFRFTPAMYSKLVAFKPGPAFLQDIDRSGSGLSALHAATHLTTLASTIGIADGTVVNETIATPNSMFDPWHDISAVQPNGRDTLAAIYANVMVIRADYEFRLTNHDAETIIVGLWFSGTTNDVRVATIKEALERPECTTMILGASSVDGDHDEGVFKGTLNMKKFVDLNTNFGDAHNGAVGSNPAQLMFAHLFFQQQDGTPVLVNKLRLTGSMRLHAVWSDVFVDTQS